jgi:pyridoxine 4-dehydrogenase
LPGSEISGTPNTLAKVMTLDADIRPAAASGTLSLGGDLPVTRLGYGAMQLTGPGIWGEPRDRDEARQVLRRAVELGVDFIDTADSYGPFISEDLIREALHPYDGVTVATKGGSSAPAPTSGRSWAGPSTCGSASR